MDEPPASAGRPRREMGKPAPNPCLQTDQLPAAAAAGGTRARGALVAMHGEYSRVRVGRGAAGLSLASQPQAHGQKHAEETGHEAEGRRQRRGGGRAAPLAPGPREPGRPEDPVTSMQLCQLLGGREKVPALDHLEELERPQHVVVVHVKPSEGVLRLLECQRRLKGGHAPDKVLQAGGVRAQRLEGMHRGGVGLQHAGLEVRHGDRLGPARPARLLLDVPMPDQGGAEDAFRRLPVGDAFHQRLRAAARGRCHGHAPVGHVVCVAQRPL
mmetsp:Transcript_23898/g.68368  ORF Transcript_23898/g.68368 Transcript_23898/m.68368 type:complete len:270 (+) Transcript_23898:105-914(+)